MKRQSPSRNEAPQSKQGARLIPDKPRDCAPHVDTWPILDTQGNAPEPATKGPVRHGKSNE